MSGVSCRWLECTCTEGFVSVSLYRYFLERTARRLTPRSLRMCSMLGLLVEFKDTILALFRTFGTAADGMSLEDFQRFAKRQHLCPRFIRPTELQKVWRDPREGGDEGTAECMDKE